jgi:hypothetical protein
VLGDVFKDVTVQLKCKVTDAAGQTVSTVSSVGSGHADFSERAV